MKQSLKLSLIAVIMLFSVAILKAQDFTTNEVRQFMSKGEQNGIEIILNGTELKAAKDAVSSWGKKLKGKVITDKKNPEIFIDNAEIPTVSANTVDIYAILTPVSNGTKMTIFTDLGGAFISSAAYGTQYTAMETALKQFAKDQAVTVVSNQQKDEEKVLKTLNSDLKKLQKDKNTYLKEIEKAKKLIQKNEESIQKNDADQAAKQQQISIQQQIIETVKSKRSTLKN